MEVDVIDRLPRVGSGIKDKSVALFINPRPLGDLFGNVDHVANNRLIHLRHLGGTRDVFFGHNEDVRLRFGRDVVKRRDPLVFVPKRRPLLASGDGAK